MSWIEEEFLGRPALTWLLAAGALIAVIIGIRVLRLAIRWRWGVRHFHASAWRALLVRLDERWMFLTTFVVAAATAAMLLRPPAPGPAISRGAVIVMLAVQGFLLAGVLTDWGVQRLMRRSQSGEPSEEAERATRHTLTGLRWLVLLAVDAVIVLIALQNLDVDITAMIAGLGIGGIAIALATQKILGDLFASLTIALDKPFMAGDLIVVGSEMGSVEHVGLKTTRVRSLSGEQLVFPNSDLLSSRIRNFKRMEARRVLFGFGVVYATPPETLERIPGIVRECIDGVSGIRFDRCHFSKFGDSSLDFEVVYFAMTADYNEHMDAQQAVLFAMARAFRDADIEFAFPTRSVHVVHEPPTDDADAEMSGPAAIQRPARRRSRN